MQFVSHLRILSLFALIAPLSTLALGQEVLLRGNATDPGLQRIKQKVDITGELHLDPHGKGVKSVPLTIHANVDFHQRMLAGGNPIRVRHYHEASADIQFGEGETAKSHSPTLRDARRTVCLTNKAGKDTYYAPAGSLTREELELIDTPLCRVDLLELLPGRKVPVGESWQHEAQTMARLLNLDTVGVTDCTSTLASVSEGKAQITLAGNVNGAVGGVDTEIELKAKYAFDTTRRRITSFSLAMREKRSVAAAEPGFEVVVKVAMAEVALADSEELSDARLANLHVKTAPQAGWLEFASPHGGYRLLHDPRWRILLDEASVTIFRFVDGGELIAQLNLSRMIRSETEAGLTLEAFSEQVGKALLENQVQLLESKQYASPAGHRVLRVEAAGTISEVPMRWVYYHVSADSGLRVAGIVTVEEKLLERFSQADTDFLNAIELLPLAEEEKESQPVETANKP